LSLSLSSESRLGRSQDRSKDKCLSKWAMLRMALKIILGKIGYFSAVALTCGSLAGIAAGLANTNVFTWFFLGSLVPWWPLLRRFSSVDYLRKVIGEYKKLYEDEVITKRQFQSLRRTAVESHSYLRFGDSRLADLKEDNSADDDVSD
jgi:hypothetical protein